MNARHDSDGSVGRDLLGSYAAAVTEGDFERWISLWVDHGIQMAPDFPQRVGKEEIHASMKPFFEMFEHEMTVDCEEVRLAGDWGLARGTYTHTLHPRDGGGKTERTGKFLTILERQGDGDWKIARDCFNYDAPLG